MPFPDKRYDSADAYAAAYFKELARAADSVDLAAFSKAAALLRDAIGGDHTIFACGNGGSAAISNHLLCDFAKGMQTDTTLRPRVISLSSHVELITAIGNDIAFEDIFGFQLKTSARSGDVLMTISSSGNSENIVRPIQWARENGLRSIALTGFGGGRSAALADVNIHVPCGNYGVVEDLHQSTMHILAQFVRMQSMHDSDLGAAKF